VIAEIVSLSGYETQVSALLGEDERMAMEFAIACALEDHPLIPGPGGFSQGPLGAAMARKERWISRRVFLSRGAGGGFIWREFTQNPKRKRCRQPIKTRSVNLRRKSRRQQREDHDGGR
jgi:hypothetical protein